MPPSRPKPQAGPWPTREVEGTPGERRAAAGSEARPAPGPSQDRTRWVQISLDKSRAPDLDFPLFRTILRLAPKGRQ